MIYKCGHCGFTGHCYGIATNVGVTIPYCPKCGMNDKLTEVIVEEIEDKVEEFVKPPDSAKLPNGDSGTLPRMSLPKDHWLLQDGIDDSPMPLRVGTGETLCSGVGTRDYWVEMIRQAGKYAARAATRNGQDMDFDPDALIQNLIVGFLGYWTPNGLPTSVLENDGMTKGSG